MCVGVERERGTESTENRGKEGRAEGERERDLISCVKEEIGERSSEGNTGTHTVRRQQVV